MGGLEVPDGAADVVEEALGLYVRVAGTLQGAVHATLSEGHASGDGSRSLGGEHCWFAPRVSEVVNNKKKTCVKMSGRRVSLLVSV